MEQHNKGCGMSCKRIRRGMCSSVASRIPRTTHHAVEADRDGLWLVASRLVMADDMSLGMDAKSRVWLDVRRCYT